MYTAWPCKWTYNIKCMKKTPMSFLSLPAASVRACMCLCLSAYALQVYGSLHHLVGGASELLIEGSVYNDRWNVTLPATTLMENQLDAASGTWLNPHRLKHINDLSDTVSKKRYTADDDMK